MEMVGMHTTIVYTKEKHMTTTRTKITLKTDHAMRGLSIFNLIDNKQNIVYSIYTTTMKVKQ